MSRYDCPVHDYVLKPLRLDRHCWRLVFLAPMVRYILADKVIDGAEKSALRTRRQQLRRRDDGDTFVDCLLIDEKTRSDAMKLLKLILKGGDPEQRKQHIEDIVEGLLELTLGDSYRQYCGSLAKVQVDDDDWRVLQSICEELGLSASEVPFGPQMGPGEVVPFVGPDFSSTASEDVPTAEKSSPVPPVIHSGADSSAEVVWKRVADQAALNQAVLATVDAFVQKTRIEFETAIDDPHALLMHCRENGRPFRYRGLVVLPEGSFDEDTYFVGDIHGDYEILLRVLGATNFLANDKVKLVFLGDYVDRGPGSLAVLLRVIELKLAHWDRVHLLKGNHESLRLVEAADGGASRWMSGTADTSFVREVHLHLPGGEGVWQKLHGMFQVMNHVLVVGSEIMVCHGGVIPRFPEEVPAKGVMSDELRRSLMVEHVVDLVKPTVAYYMLWARCAWKPLVTCIWNGDSLSTKVFDFPDVVGFLDRIGVRYLVRGHDHPEEGYFVDPRLPRMLTLCTSRAMDVPSLWVCTPKIARYRSGQLPEAVDI